MYISPAAIERCLRCEELQNVCANVERQRLWCEGRRARVLSNVGLEEDRAGRRVGEGQDGNSSLT